MHAWHPSETCLGCEGQGIRVGLAQSHTHSVAVFFLFSLFKEYLMKSPVWKVSPSAESVKLKTCTENTQVNKAQTPREPQWACSDFTENASALLCLKGRDYALLEVTLKWKYHHCLIITTVAVFH